MTFLYKNTSLNLICCRFVLGKKNVKDVIINEDDNLIIFFCFIL